MDKRREPWGPRCAGGGWERWLSDESERPSLLWGGDRRRLPWLSTLVVTAFVQIGTGFAAKAQPDRVPLDAAAHLLLLAGSLLLLLRHRAPRVVAFGTAGATTVYLASGYPYGPVFLTVALGCFAAIVAGARRAAWTAVGLMWAGHLLIAHWLYRWLPPAGDTAAPWGQELIVLAWVAAIVAGAELVRVRREHIMQMRAARVAAERRRADEERLRIARELHDVLAHSLSVINVQAGVGLALLDNDPEQARTALTAIKGASKEALGEVRQVLDTLRGQGRAPRSPAPGLDRLNELAAQAKSAGLDVRVTREGAESALPAGADIAAFRILQEALTNIVRHSGARTARVHLARSPAELLIQVDDDGPATSGGLPSGGNGLVGMRERAAALGGTVEAGPRPDGGFTVRAVLPLRDTPSDRPAGRPGGRTATAGGRTGGAGGDDGAATDDGSAGTGAPADGSRAEGARADGSRANGATEEDAS